MNFLLLLSLLALSQDENEMGRFLREQGSQDKSKAGKMMIAVGKAQSYSAQQRYIVWQYMSNTVYDIIIS